MKKTSKVTRSLTVFLASGALTAVFGLSLGSEAASVMRRMTGSTSCHGSGWKVDDTRYRGFRDSGIMFTTTANNPNGDDFVCALPSDSLLSHSNYSKITVRGMNRDTKGDSLVFKVCAGDSDSESYVCGTGQVAGSGKGEDGVFYSVDVLDISKLRRSKYKSWYPVLVGEGMTTSRSVHGYKIKGQTELELD